MSHTWSLTTMRIRLALRNRAFFFFSIVMPLLFLLGAVLFFGRGKTEWMGYILGAILTVTVMGSFWGLSVQLVTFREQGILRRFRLAPMGAGPMLASSILSNYFMALPVVVLEILVCRLAFHMQSWGNLWAIFILVTIGSATFSALGLIVASVTNTMQETQMINNLIWMGFLFLSGATIPLAAFPGWLQRVALFIPAPSPSCRSSSVTDQPCFSPYIRYIRSSISAQSWLSVPPAPELICMTPGSSSSG